VGFVYQSGEHAKSAAAPTTLSARMAGTVFGGLLAFAVAHFGWMYHLHGASAAEFVARLPLSLLFGLPFYAAGGYAFARLVEKPPWYLSQELPYPGLVIFFGYGIACGVLRWFVIACGVAVQAIRGEASLRFFSLFLLLPQIEFSVLLAFGAATAPAIRLHRLARDSKGRLPLGPAVGWMLLGWLAVLFATYLFESGTGALLPARP
jgi:hypothetical protein